MQSFTKEPLTKNIELNRLTERYYLLNDNVPSGGE